MIAKTVILVLCLYSSTIAQEFPHFLLLDLPSAVENIWLTLPFLVTGCCLTMFPGVSSE